MKKCNIEKIAVTDGSVMLIFKGKCIDARYEYECQFFKTITGYGVRNDKDSTYIEVSPTEWLKIDPATLKIYFDVKVRMA